MSSSAKRSWEPWVALLVPALLLLGSITRAGIWDPYELNVADLARRAAVNLFGAQDLVLASGENRIPTLGDLGRGELPITSMAVAFRLFGLSEWAGRLPLALWGLAGVAALWWLLRRMSGERAATYGALALVTMPLYFVQARTMLGDIVTMAALLLATTGLALAVLDDELSARARTLAWLLGALGLVAGFYARGGLVGVAVPTLTVAAAALVAGSRERAAPIALGAVGLLATVLAVRALARATPGVFEPWVGAAVIAGQKLPTFDTVIQYLGHSLFPWSAFLPLAFGRLLAPPPGASGPSLVRETRLRAVLLIGGALAYGAHGWLAVRTGYLPFSGVGFFAAVVALALVDFERGAHPSRSLAVATLLLGVILYLDFSRMPEKGLSAFAVANATLPESFHTRARQLLQASFLLMAAPLFLAFLDGHQPYEDDRELPPLRRFTAYDDVKRIVNELNEVWEGNLAFFAIMLEAMLVGVGGLLFFGDRFHWKIALRDVLGGPLKIAAINAWWALPLGALAAVFVFLTVRHLFRFALARTGIARAQVAMASCVAGGLVLSLGYYPALAAQLSPKEVFEAYRRVHRPGQPLGLLGVAGRSAAYYGAGDAMVFGETQAAFDWLTETPDRRFVALRSEDLAKMNSLFRERARSGQVASPDHNLPVLDARSSQIQLVSNQLLPGERNENTLARWLSIASPNPAHPLDVDLDDQLRAIGWDLYDSTDETRVDVAVPARTYFLHLHYLVLAPVTTQWRSFIHIDGFGRRFNGDHDVFDNKYPMSLWQPGDIVTDRFELKLEPNFSPGSYTLFYGFFVGERRLAVKSGRHQENRIDGGPFPVR